LERAARGRRRTLESVSTDQATITVSRTAPDDIGLREIFVSLDGQSIAILENGQSVTRTVAPGAHEVRAHNTLIRKRVTLDLTPGEHARLLAVNRAGKFTFSVLALLGAGPVYLTLERVDDPPPPPLSPAAASM
jgi:hypothetical protein